MPHRLWKRCALALAAVIVPIAACTLNPQPIPPGDQYDAGRGGDDGSFDEQDDAAGQGTAAADAGAPPPLGPDASDGAGDHPEAGIPDAGDGGDAADADASG
jgi:hypothetical protein